METVKTRWFSPIGALLGALFCLVLLVLAPTVIGQWQRAAAARNPTQQGGRRLAREMWRMRADTASTDKTCFADPAMLLLDSLPEKDACGIKMKCDVAPAGKPCWGGPYLHQLPKDEWGSDYLVAVEPDIGITITSLGQNGRLDSDPDESDDIVMRN